MNRIQPFTAQQSAEWQARKQRQYATIIEPAFVAATEDPVIMVGCIQTGDVFIVEAQTADGGWRDEFCLGRPAKSVTRDDKVHHLSAIDPTDAQVEAVVRQWKALKKVSPS